LLDLGDEEEGMCGVSAKVLRNKINIINAGLY